MPLSPATSERIEAYFEQVTLRFVRETPIVLSKPFHESLLPQIPWSPLSEHSFATRSGNWFSNVAAMVAEQFHAEVLHPVRGTRFDGHLRGAAAGVINEIMSQLDAPVASRRIPDRAIDLEDALRNQRPGGEEDFQVVDFYVKRHDGGEMFFELKTPQPNKAHCEKMKRMILKIMAMKKGLPVEAYGACAYNPYNANGTADGYAWGFTSQFLEIGKGFLVGRQFWEKVGDPTTFDEVWTLAAAAGRKTRSEVDRILALRTAALMPTSD